MKVTIDVETLREGEPIPLDAIRRDLPSGLSEREFWMQAHIWMQSLQAMLLDQGYGWTVALRKGQVMVLGGVEASEHNARRFKQAIAKMARRNVLTRATSTEGMPTPERMRHEHRLRVQGAVMGSVARARAEVGRMPAVRPTPVSNVKGE